MDMDMDMDSFSSANLPFPTRRRLTNEEGRKPITECKIRMFDS